jgi:hypothetical protein
MLEVLTILIFLFPFVALVGLYLSEAERWRRHWRYSFGLTVFCAFLFYLLWLDMLWTLEGFKVFGHRLDRGEIPMRGLMHNGWLALGYTLLVLVVFYVANRRQSRAHQL